MKKITRRQFLTSAGATSAALLLSSLPHAAAADENCLRKVTPATTNSNDLSWDMAEEILTHISDPVFPAYTVNVLCSATSFLRNWDSILEKKRANLRSISEPARLRQPPPQKHGSGTRKRAGSKHTGGATNSRPSRAFCPLVG